MGSKVSPRVPLGKGWTGSFHLVIWDGRLNQLSGEEGKFNGIEWSWWTISFYGNLK